MSYDLMREFADSWGLLAMALFFVGSIAFALRPGGKTQAERAAQIPLKGDRS
ncbi:MAG: cbb3-type cytochrome c oxidase subunit 3 [Mesorhizobium sp.]|uniref:cbb3-type cytochrome c oxidase subunit 3 n=1 Tax=unclassified Mesorhizobium TaxID=325217 RepID=UPI000BAEC3EC|nr:MULTISPECIES: cbb3-type cytochrome c oxidase subunit 3 [unclassified Mesorhizobium]RVC78697.1 cbb3-type cytochrome c oxidase subunit 3 [Mesorhizobium sp. M2A.F.Ca.ET.046.02.1.1]AZO34051.1 cbb3-type cytochrome c oxidase subunit 3 [Mesorhizobium sp. M2A.F.Ca.ET.046.03.2.1]AZO71474.1 cbb3-type cytochrome c oxidase subunit 3 [Mesorhizobium sp. M1D.F.Ca.ET.043.01.1.1]PBC04335.1 CcoQ/FixQ family Cbb3-type cytochrome c oxidase assembly chaperone [Mesorhizobium sp. WSM3860]RWB39444.1 MAG: cbb3-type